MAEVSGERGVGGPRWKNPLRRHAGIRRSSESGHECAFCVPLNRVWNVADMVGDSWEFERFSPMDAIPTAISLTTYVGGRKVFTIDEVVEAHRTMEENKAGGKIVITT